MIHLFKHVQILYLFIYFKQENKLFILLLLYYSLNLICIHYLHKKKLYKYLISYYYINKII